MQADNVDGNNTSSDDAAMTSWQSGADLASQTGGMRRIMALRKGRKTLYKVDVDDDSS